MKKGKWTYRGVKPKEFQSLKKKGIPSGTVFTTDYFVAKKHGKVIAVPFSKSGLKATKDNEEAFQRLKLKERYFVTTKKRKRFTKIGEL